MSKWPPFSPADPRHALFFFAGQASLLLVAGVGLCHVAAKLHPHVKPCCVAVLGAVCFLCPICEA